MRAITTLAVLATCMAPAYAADLGLSGSAPLQAASSARRGILCAAGLRRFTTSPRPALPGFYWRQDFAWPAGPAGPAPNY